jgi:predicted phosphoribosyltransferase/dienelactone hydrolase
MPQQAAPEIDASPFAGGRRFRDRREAGRSLARSLAAREWADPVVIALPRGGVPVGYEVARALDAPLDIGLVRKLGAPMQPELGIGALGECGEAIIDQEAVRRLGIPGEELRRTIDREWKELQRRQGIYRRDHPPVAVDGHPAIVVDDGLATGVTAAAAARVLRARGAAPIVLAVPVCPADVRTWLREAFDEIVCLGSPRPFLGVGAAYEDFSQTSDREVVELLRRSRSERGGPQGSPERPGTGVDERAVSISDAGVTLHGSLALPPDATGLVIFAHGSGSSRHSPRNRAVAAHLNRAGLGTVLFDLLTDREAADRSQVFDVDLLAKRLLAACRWAAREPAVAKLPIGLFGASTGAAAALRVAAVAPELIVTVVSRGGRPDLAGAALRHVQVPVLLLVGGEDRKVLALNQRAAGLLAGRQQLAVIPGAGHLFEEPGALEQVAALSAEWFAARFESAGRRGRGRTMQARQP